MYKKVCPNDAEMAVKLGTKARVFSGSKKRIRSRIVVTQQFIDYVRSKIESGECLEYRKRRSFCCAKNQVFMAQNLTKLQIREFLLLIVAGIYLMFNHCTMVFEKCIITSLKIIFVF